MAMNFRTVPLPLGINAHDIFQYNPREFATLLEDPHQLGRQVLVSAKGQSESFSLTDRDALVRWKASIPAVIDDAGLAISQVFYIAYEAVHWLERMPMPRMPICGPVLYLHEPEWSLCLDHQQGCVYIAAKQCNMLGQLEAMLASVKAYVDASDEATTATKIHEITSDYAAHVNQVKTYIREGDVFQANIARFWHAAYAAKQLPHLYAMLRKKNPAPFSAFFRAGPLTIVSSSPERLFQITPDGWLNTRPIAGTRPRGQGDDDQAMRSELLLSEKEQAEHIMLVDLERNDLGRVCQAGTIEVNECMVIERYATVQHIVSNVRGRLSDGLDIVDVFRALFPGGTITGCPKVRCMEIIHELEPQARGPYTGGLGYIASDGSCDSNILIRSFWHEDDTLHWAAGAGIVADSIAAQELQETNHKVKGLLSALE